jgi:hypothetical protein
MERGAVSMVEMTNSEIDDSLSVCVLSIKLRKAALI